MTTLQYSTITITLPSPSYSQPKALEMIQVQGQTSDKSRYSYNKSNKKVAIHTVQWEFLDYFHEFLPLCAFYDKTVDGAYATFVWTDPYGVTRNVSFNNTVLNWSVSAPGKMNVSLELREVL